MIDAGSLENLAYRLDPSLLMQDIGFEPDPWQRRVLRSRARRMLLLCSRQSGKSTTTAVLALNTVLHEPDALVLILSPTQRQSGELFLKLKAFYAALGRPQSPVKETETTLFLENGSRVVSLPGSPDTVRSFSAAHTVLVDEAAMADDGLFVAVSPMLAVSNGRLILLSSPKGQRGYFYDQWNGGESIWDRVCITADDCPRITPEFLEGERMTMGESWFMQEYYCQFNAVSGQYFATDVILNAFACQDRPLFGDTQP